MSSQFAPSVSETVYSLPGKANANTVPATGAPDAASAAQEHAASQLTVLLKAGATSLPPIPVDPAYFDVSTVTVGGYQAQLSVPKDGWGTYRLDWLDGAGYHVVMCDRLTTSDGPSGLSAAELVKVAQSLYG